MPHGKPTGKPSGMMGPKKKTPKDKPSAKVNMPAYPGKSDGKKVNMPAKLGKGIGKKVNVSSMGSKDPIGPQTKREARKSNRKSKVVTPMAAPPIDRSIETPESKAAKRKERMKTVGAALGVAGATIGTILADARFTRGAERIRGNSTKKVTPKDAWRAGKNKKSTKK
jgi:hypothetical protein